MTVQTSTEEWPSVFVFTNRQAHGELVGVRLLQWGGAGRGLRLLRPGVALPAAMDGFTRHIDCRGWSGEKSEANLAF